MRCPVAVRRFNRAGVARPSIGLVMIALVLSASSGRAFAQSTAAVMSDPGSTISMTLELDIGTNLGTLSGSDSDTAAAAGDGTITLFPTAPPFQDVLVQSLSVQLDPLEFEYHFLFGLITINVTVSDLAIETTDMFAGPLDENGRTTFPDAPLLITGATHVVCEFFGVDEYEPVNIATNGLVSMRITESGGVVVLDEIEFPVFHSTSDPAELPEGVTSLEITQITDASNLIYRGPYGPSLLGDFDADGDVDLADYREFVGCHLGPDVPAEVVCTLFDFDGDDDVDLMDFAGFQRAFGGP